MDENLYQISSPRPQLPVEQAGNPTSQISRNMEASALSALLVPGGQIPSVPLANSNIRPLGRPTITKISSPYLDNNERIQEQVDQLLAKEDSHLSGSSVDETVKVVEDGDFNWYFQHYNDTDLEPFVGVVYGSGLPSKGWKIELSVGIVTMFWVQFIL